MADNLNDSSRNERQDTPWLMWLPREEGGKGGGDGSGAKSSE